MGHSIALFVYKTSANDHIVVINSISPTEIVGRERADIYDAAAIISERVNSTVRTRRQG
jgi:hypothetical protein